MDFTIFSLFDTYWKRFLSIFLIVELLSFVSFFYETVHAVVFFVLIALTFILSIKNLSYGLYILLGELFVGSFGYLFWYDIGSFRFSFRLGLFLVVFVAGAIYNMRQKTCPFVAWKYFWPYMLLMFVLTSGILNGYLHGHSLKSIFLDMNGYLYFGMIAVFFAVIQSREVLQRIVSLFLAAITSMFLKTLLLLYIFTHQHSKTYIGFVYKWVRDTRVGEITDFDYFYRIFFQSHIYVVVFLFAIFTSLIVVFERKKRSLKLFFSEQKTSLLTLGVFLVFSTFVLIVSYSRSFWVGVIGGGIVFFYALLRFHYLSLKQFIYFAVFSFISIVFGLLLVSVVIKAPSPFISDSSDFSALSLIEDRTETEGEIALGSRFALLAPLLDAVKDDILVGSGFGTVVAYQSQDPRAIESSNGGLYETFSFEWGYLDTITEVGIIGLGVYLWFLYLILKQGWKLLQNKDVEVRIVASSLFFGLVVFCVVHVFTPYLNHPLGLGFLMLTSAAFSYLSSYSSQKL